MIKIERHNSPNFSSRMGAEVTAVVIHYTGDGPEWNPVKWLCMRESKVSAHCVIERDGSIHRIVRFRDMAWHAGESRIEGQPDVNRFTIGIEMANCGSLLSRTDRNFYWTQGNNLKPYNGPAPVRAELLYRHNDRIIERYWEPYTEEAIKSLGDLLSRISDIGYEDAAKNLYGHEEVSPGRKSDPGPLFPWDKFERKNPKQTESRIIHG